jgi:hypothetical protein
MTAPIPDDEIQRRVRSAVIRAVLLTSVAFGTIAAALLGAGYLQARGATTSRQPAPPATAPFDTVENPNWIGVGIGSTPPSVPTGVAEVLPAPPAGGTLTGLAPYIAWSVGPVHSRLLVEVRELEDPRDPIGGMVVAAGLIERFDLPRGTDVNVELDRHVVLTPGKYYSFRFAAEDRNLEVGIGVVDVGDPTPEGRLWIFARPVGGNGGFLSERPEWIVQDQGDIVFRLIFDGEVQP